MLCQLLGKLLEEGRLKGELKVIGRFIEQHSNATTIMNLWNTFKL